MNFKMQDKQNQLIERISDTYLIIGVDIAQQLHVARAVNFRGIVVGLRLKRSIFLKDKLYTEKIV